MEAVDLARWQFAITTVYHFFFVPVTIGLSGLVAGLHTAWVRTHNPEYYRLTKFFGKLFVINFALGLVTGIVQEFQFGMNWSDYSRFVGDIFGAPLAFEALLSFFLESTFIGLWIFGWGRLPEKLHAATMWLTHIGTVISAYFILAANSFMQNPVGYRYNPDTGRAEMSDFAAVLFNKVQLVTFPHVITTSYMVGGAVILGVALWHLRRTSLAEGHIPQYRKAAKLGAIVTLVAGLAVCITGDLQAKVMTDVQPMKMAAAEAHYETSTQAKFSVLSVGSLDGNEATHIITVPGLLSYLGKGSFDAEIQGINDIRKEYTQKYSSNRLTLDNRTEYTPNIPTTYWSFRLMMGAGFLAMLIAALALLALRKPTPSEALKAAWWKYALISVPFLPVFAASFGWIFTELGRQPWLVTGLMTTWTGVSPAVPAWAVLVSMIVYTLVYAILAVVELKLFVRYVKLGAEAVGEPPASNTSFTDGDDADQPLVYAY